MTKEEKAEKYSAAVNTGSMNLGSYLQNAYLAGYAECEKGLLTRASETELTNRSKEELISMLMLAWEVDSDNQNYLDERDAELTQLRAMLKVAPEGLEYYVDWYRNPQLGIANSAINTLVRLDELEKSK